jgi:hypothetical protein
MVMLCGLSAVRIVGTTTPGLVSSEPQMQDEGDERKADKAGERHSWILNGPPPHDARWWTTFTTNAPFKGRLSDRAAGKR